MEKRWKAGADAASAVLLVALNVVLYRKVTRLWWTWDDIAVLRIIVEHSFWAPFVDGSVSQKLFTPLLMALFDLEKWLFGFDARGFYLLHLGIAIAVTLAVYAAARVFLTAGPALSAAVMVAAGLPFSALVAQLSAVHYLIVILFGAFVVIAWHFALRKNNLGASSLSALFYLIGLLAKEVIVPLPAILLLLPIRDLRSRLRHTTGHLIALIIYLLWRRAVLGMFTGGYGWMIELNEWPRMIVLLPWKLLVSAAGSNIIVGSLLIASMAIVIVFGIRGRRAWMIVLLAAIVSVAPYLPVTKEVFRRYAAVPWLAASIIFAVAADRIPQRRLRAAVLIAVPIVAIFANRQEWVREFGLRLRMSDEGRFFLEMPDGGLMRNPASTRPEMERVNWLRNVVLGRPGRATCFYDDIYLCVNDTSARRAWHYEASKRAVVEITSQIPEIARRHCSAMRMDAPLFARFWYRDSVLYWDLGPYRDGRYMALLGNGLQVGEIFKHNALRVEGDGVTLRIRYDSPEGWTTYSPELTLDFVKQPQFQWSR